MSVEGEVAKPQKFSVDDLMALAPLEERIYRHRCVEAWSIVVPWIGYSLSVLINKVQPTAKAKYVQFFSDARPQADARRARARPRLALSRRLAHGRSHASADDAVLRPVRRGAAEPERRAAAHRDSLEVRLQEHQVAGARRSSCTTQPETSWNTAAPNEYGFYSNVNPNVDHPRWSQKTERRLGGSIFSTARQPTLMFNGYGDQVASLYTGMDLRKNF